MPFGTHGFRGDVRAILFPRKGIWRNTVTPIFHEITVCTQASSHKQRQLRCLSNRSRMHGLIRKNASFLNHITFRYIYIHTHTHSRVENTLIILSQEVSLNYHNFFPSHPPLFLITDQPTDSIPFRSIPRLPLISRIKRSIPRIDSPPPLLLLFPRALACPFPGWISCRFAYRGGGN